MQIRFNLGAEEVLEKLKSAYGSNLSKGKELYYVNLSWFNSVKVLIKPIDKQNTWVALSIQLPNIAYHFAGIAAAFFYLWTAIEPGTFKLFLILCFFASCLFSLFFGTYPYFFPTEILQKVASSIGAVQQQTVHMPPKAHKNQAQIKEQRLRQLLNSQAQLTRQLQREVAQTQMSKHALAQKQHELTTALKEKEELESKLAEAQKNTPIVQNITYNIQDSAISGDIRNKIAQNDLE